MKTAKINIDTLRSISDANLNRLNRNVDVQKILNDYPTIQFVWAVAELIENRAGRMIYRCKLFSQLEDGTLLTSLGYQDFFDNQFEKLSMKFVFFKNISYL